MFLLSIDSWIGIGNKFDVKLEKKQSFVRLERLVSIVSMRVTIKCLYLLVNSIEMFAKLITYSSQK